MKKSLLVFLAIILLSFTSMNAAMCANAMAGQDRPVSLWMEQGKGNIEKSEQSTNSKISTKQQAHQRRSDIRNAEKKRKQAERKIQVENKKRELRSLFTKSK